MSSRNTAAGATGIATSIDGNLQDKMTQENYFFMILTLAAHQFCQGKFVILS